MSLFTARESNQFNSFLSSLEVEEAGPPPPSQWPGGGGGNEPHQGFSDSRESSYSYRLPLSPSQYLHQQSQPPYPSSSSSYASNAHSQKRRISGSATASSSSPSSSLPWPQPEIGLVHVPPSPIRRTSQHFMAAPRIERRGSAEWTVPIFRSLRSPRDGLDSEREGARGRPSTGTMGLVDHLARPRQSLPPPHGSSPGGSSSSYPPSTSQHLGPPAPRLPKLLPPPNGSSTSRSLSPSKANLQHPHQQHQLSPSHPHAQRPSNSYRSHPIPVPSSSSSTSTSLAPQQPTPNSVFSAPPMPPLRARSPVIPALLTASQKKANHIASEQKRRANIRRGYDALCDEIPSLRAASRLEALKSSGAGAGAGGTGRRGSRARKNKVEGGTAEPEKAEKVDGRSGPKSEGVVLVKTIEHLRDLLGQRIGLLSRLDHLRSQVKASYPREEHSRLGLEGGGPWEMEWEGGKEEDQGSDEEGEE